jgi:hypothetical protein
MSDEKDEKRGGLRNQLGTFMKSTMVQLDALREEVAKKSRAGRIQLDVAWLKRKRRDVLADLGEAVAQLAAKGEIDEEKYPSLSGVLARLEALDERIARETDRARVAGGGVPEPADEDDEEDAGSESDEAR